MKRFEIKTAIDLMRANQLLADHREQLSSLKDQRAINYTQGCIGELTEEINGYEEDEYWNQAAPPHGSLYGEPCGDRY